jgi:small subunit ribosomal protein S3Ae
MGVVYVFLSWQFAVAFTKKNHGQVKKTAYAQAAQVRAIRKKIVDVIKEEVEKNDLRSLVKRL